ncbi:MAG TPA: hypothetical protein VMU15_17090 [Anaeromyxobacter sp.]|nr:hypothetical protein [Anaeromyxobacter sp.]
MSAERLDIAGVRIDLQLGERPPAGLERLARFGGAGGPADWSLEVRAGASLPAGPPGRNLVVEEGRWVFPGAAEAAWLDPAARSGLAPVDPGFLALDTLLRAAVAEAVLGRGGILLHGVAVAVDGAAHLCPARSGSGKSTLAARSRHPLSDEISVLLPGSGGGFVAHATPWWSSRGGAAPLAAVYQLAWGGEGVERLSRTALRALAANLVLPVDTPANRRRALAVAAAVASAVPFARLAFRPDSDVDALIRRGWPRG